MRVSKANAQFFYDSMVASIQLVVFSQLEELLNDLEKYRDTDDENINKLLSVLEKTHTTNNIGGLQKVYESLFKIILKIGDIKSLPGQIWKHWSKPLPKQLQRLNSIFANYKFLQKTFEKNPEDIFGESAMSSFQLAMFKAYSLYDAIDNSYCEWRYPGNSGQKTRKTKLPEEEATIRECCKMVRMIAMLKNPNGTSANRYTEAWLEKNHPSIYFNDLDDHNDNKGQKKRDFWDFNDSEDAAFKEIKGRYRYEANPSPHDFLFFNAKNELIYDLFRIPSLKNDDAIHIIESELKGCYFKKIEIN